MPTLTEASSIRKILASIPGIGAQAGLVSGAALLQGPGGSQVRVPVFGVDAAEYFSLFPALRFIEGGVPQGPGAWIVLPASRADGFLKTEGRRLAIGDSLQFTMASGNAFTIRAVRLAGIVETPIREDADLAAVYTDPSTLRSLLGLSLGNAVPAPNAVKGDSIDIGSFFSSSEDTTKTTIPSGARGLELLSQTLSAEHAQAAAVVDPSKGAWHFVLARLQKGATASAAIRMANSLLAKAGIKAQAVGWLPVAGLNASILFLLKTVFEIGIGILAGVVVLVITNGLAYSVIEQTKEIGTMRAIGAQSLRQQAFSHPGRTARLRGSLAGGRTVDPVPGADRQGRRRHLQPVPLHAVRDSPFAACIPRGHRDLRPRGRRRGRLRLFDLPHQPRHARERSPIDGRGISEMRQGFVVKSVFRRMGGTCSW